MAQNERQEQLWGEPTTSAVEMTINNGYFFPVTGFAGCPNYLDIISAEVVLYPPTKYRKHAQSVILSFTSHASDGMESERKLNSLERLTRLREINPFIFTPCPLFFESRVGMWGAMGRDCLLLDPEKSWSIKSALFKLLWGMLLCSLCPSYVLRKHMEIYQFVMDCLNHVNHFICYRLFIIMSDWNQHWKLIVSHCTKAGFKTLQKSKILQSNTRHITH